MRAGGGGMLRHLARTVAAIVVYSSGLAWFFVFAYSDWLRFSSPKLPNLATRQTVFEKAVRGVFYVTPQQAFWTQTTIPVIFLSAVCGLLVLRFLKDDTTTTIERPRLLGMLTAQSMADKLLGIVIVIWLIGAACLMLFGDQVMSLIFDGSISIPANPHG